MDGTSQYTVVAASHAPCAMVSTISLILLKDLIRNMWSSSGSVAMAASWYSAGFSPTPIANMVTSCWCRRPASVFGD